MRPKLKRPVQGFGPPAASSITHQPHTFTFNIKGKTTSSSFGGAGPSNGSRFDFSQVLGIKINHFCGERRWRVSYYQAFLQPKITDGGESQLCEVFACPRRYKSSYCCPVISKRATFTCLERFMFKKLEAVKILQMRRARGAASGPARC